MQHTHGHQLIKLRASHGKQFKTTEEFSPLKNTSDYAKNKSEQEKVIKMANEFDPVQYLQAGASASVGPVMVSQRTDGVYCVLVVTLVTRQFKILVKALSSSLRICPIRWPKCLAFPKRRGHVHLVVRLLPNHSVEDAAGIAVANEIIDLLNPSEGLVESTATMAHNDAKLLKPDELLPLAETRNIDEQIKVIESLIARGRVDRNTRVRVVNSKQEAAAYADNLLMAKAFGEVHGPTIADYALSGRAETVYKDFLKGPVEAMVKLDQGYADVSEAFGRLMSQLVD